METTRRGFFGQLAAVCAAPVVASPFLGDLRIGDEAYTGLSYRGVPLTETQYVPLRLSVVETETDCFGFTRDREV